MVPSNSAQRELAHDPLAQQPPYVSSSEDLVASSEAATLPVVFLFLERAKRHLLDLYEGSVKKAAENGELF